MHIRTVFSVNQGQTITRRSDQRCLQNQLCRLLVELHWRNWKRFNTRRKEHVRNVELCKSGSNIASHAWTNNHKIDFNGKIIDKGTFDTEERLSHVTLHAQKTQITIQNIYRINTAFYLGKNFKYSIIVT